MKIIEIKTTTNFGLLAVSKILVSLIPVSLLSIFEIRIQQIIGKGWGAQSVEIEATASFALLGKYFPKSEDVNVFDVGANIGKWTEGALKNSNAKVICFEPSKKAFENLEQKFQTNPRVHLENLALGLKTGSENLYSDAPGSSLSSLSKRDLRHFDLKFEFVEKVNMETLDDWITRNGISPDILKIDVEGFELEVLKGGENSLAEIKVIQFEFGGCNIDTRTYFRDFWHFLNNKNYSLFRLSPRGLIQVSQYSESLENFTTSNYYAVNKSLIK